MAGPDQTEARRAKIFFRDWPFPLYKGLNDRPPPPPPPPSRGLDPAVISSHYHYSNLQKLRKMIRSVSLGHFDSKDFSIKRGHGWSCDAVIKKFFQVKLEDFLVILSLKLLVVFSVTPFKIDQNKTQNRLIVKVQNLGNKGAKYLTPSPRFRSEEYFVYEISGEMFCPNL